MRRLGFYVFIVTLVAGLSAGVASAQTEKPAAGATKPAATKSAKTPRAKTTKLSLTEACEIDSAIYCDDDEHRGVSKVACLRKNKSLVSASCASALGGR